MKEQEIRAIADEHRAQAVAFDAVADVQALIETVAVQLTAREDVAQLTSCRLFVAEAMRNGGDAKLLLRCAVDAQFELQRLLGALEQPVGDV